MPELRITQDELDSLINALAHENDEHLEKIYCIAVLLEESDKLPLDIKQASRDVVNTAINECSLLKKLWVIDVDGEQKNRAIEKIDCNIEKLGKTLVLIDDTPVDEDDQKANCN